VAAAVGFDRTRGDSISVESFQFAPAINPMEEEAAKRQYWIDLAKFLAPFALLFLSVLAWLVFKLATRKKIVAVDDADLMQVEEVEEEPIEKIVVQTKTLEELKAEIEEEFNAESASQAPEAQRREVIKQRISEIIITDPENAASLVRTWLVDDEAK
jgi:flagellar M-ring protein FliF